jgi:two-component system sensor histidine kinase KdpD
MTRDNRINADSLLKLVEADARARQRGKLKIFFGSSAGVGKTYAMLTEAQRRRAEGVDIVIGNVVTHGRPETMALVNNLPVIPLREEDYKGILISEFDLDAALVRKPAIILVDEFAHTNAPGSRHPKRWQDIEELLDASIDVYTTLNVQHLESLNDIVESITGVAVRETVPDMMFDNADDVVLVDVPPDELLRRLQEGKVYIAPGANERAIQHFFKKTNLLSLRELALRRTAEYVDADTDDERLREGLQTPNAVGERVLVCIGPDKLAAKLVRTARRLAAGLKAPWTAVYIEPPETKQNPRLRDHIQQILASAERNGAHIVNMSGGRIGDELLAYARTHGITKIIIGKSVRPHWQEILRPNLVSHIIRHSGDIDVYVVTGAAGRLSPALQKRLSPKWRWQKYAQAVVLAAGLTAIGFYLQPLFSKTDVAMLYLMGAVLAAVICGRGASLLYTFISIGSFNYFFIEPIYSFNIYDRSYWLTLIVMGTTSFVISSQAARLREQAELSRSRERKTQVFYNLTRILAATHGQHEICDLVIKHIEEAVGVQSAIWLPQTGNLEHYAGQMQGDPSKEEMVARWSFDNVHVAGFGTNTLPSAAGYYLPIIGRETALGVLALFIAPTETSLRSSEIETLSTMASLLASALEREAAESLAEKTRLASEQERLRNLLLSSISHDLRTPLAAIGGAAETLSLRPLIRQDAVTLSLAKSIQHETNRLNRIINNLLDVTRYEDNLQLNLEPYFLPEIIGSAIAVSQELLKEHELITDIEENLPLVRIDAVLINQVLVNMLENAAKHTQHGTAVTISAHQSPGGILLSIADNGVGIPLGQERFIFEKFATYTRGDQAKGIGLGLAICQAIITAHGGKIWAENQPQGGALFSIILPNDLIVRQDAQS